MNYNIIPAEPYYLSAVDKNGFCLLEKSVNEKSNEIIAIPELLNDLNIKVTSLQRMPWEYRPNRKEDPNKAR